MHVGLDLVFLVPGQTGGRETYARELVAGLRRVAPDLRLTTFLNAETAAAGPGWWTAQADRAVVLPRVSAGRRAAWAVGETIVLPRAAARAGVDVLHSPANFAPLAGPFARVMNVHDLLFRDLPDLHAPLMRWGTEALVPPAARRATRVITGSHWSAERIVDALGVPRERLDVVLNGLGTPVVAGDAAAARSRLGAGERDIVLGLATDLPHKNLAGLVDAHAALDAPARPLLAVAGAGTDAGALPALVARHGTQADVRLLGAVPATELEDLFAAASVYATPTLYEGFGLPILEAMARDVPVVCSDLPVLREVAGDVAVFADPRDPAAFAAAIAGVLTGGEDTARRRAGGLARAAEFTWDRAARETLASYARAASTRR